MGRDSAVCFACRTAGKDGGKSGGKIRIRRTAFCLAFPVSFRYNGGTGHGIHTRGDVVRKRKDDQREAGDIGQAGKAAALAGEEQAKF